MTRLLFTLFRLIDLTLSICIPAAALYYIGDAADIGPLMKTAITYSLLPVWVIVFIFYRQYRFPQTLLGAGISTLILVVQTIFVAVTASLIFSLYTYFVVSLAALAILLVLGAIYMVRSKKFNKSYLFGPVFFLLMSAFAGFMTYTLSGAISAHAETLSGTAFLAFIAIVGMQFVSMTLSTARYSLSDPEEPVHPLPISVLSVGLLLSVVLAIVALLS